jgi:hypothetical protein
MLFITARYFQTTFNPEAFHHVRIIPHWQYMMLQEARLHESFNADEDHPVS